MGTSRVPELLHSSTIVAKSRHMLCPALSSFLHCYILLSAGKADCVTLVSGGDDQAIRVAVFQHHFAESWTPDSSGDAAKGNGSRLTLLCSCCVESAHTSAVRVSPGQSA